MIVALSVVFIRFNFDLIIGLNLVRLESNLQNRPFLRVDSKVGSQTRALDDV